MTYWHNNLSGARCIGFADGRSKVAPVSHYLLIQQSFTFLVFFLPMLSCKKQSLRARCTNEGQIASQLNSGYFQTTVKSDLHCTNRTISSAELQSADCVVNLRHVFSLPNSTYLVGVWYSHGIPTRKTGLYFCWLRGVVVIDDVTLVPINEHAILGQGAAVATLQPTGQQAMCHAALR